MKRLVVFFTLAYLISWTVWLPLYGPRLGIYGLPVLPFHHAIGAWGPLFAAVCTMLIFDRARIKTFLRSFVTGNAKLLTVALLGPFALSVVCQFCNAAINHVPMDLSSLNKNDEFAGWGVVAFTLYNIAAFGFGEEAGWRGFALPALQKRFSALTSSLVLTMFWATWHWPLFLYRPGYVNMDIAGLSGWLFSMLTGSVLLTWLFNSSRGSILICAIFHATVDVAFTARYNDPRIVSYMGIGVTLIGILVVLIYKPRNLSTREKITG